MTYDQLYNFTVVAELLNFTKAAEILFVSQPTLSRQIAMLEQELDTQLFTRDKQNVSLTPMGKVLLEDSLVLVQNFMKTKKHIQQLTSGTTGNLSIACMDLYCPELYHAIQQYVIAHPNILVEMASHDMGLFANTIGTKQIDVGIGFSLELRDRAAEYKTFPLFRENFVAMMNQAHPLAGRKSLTLDEVKQEQLFFLGHTKFPTVRSIWSRNGFDELINASVIAPENIHSILLQVKVTPHAMVLLPRSIALEYTAGCSIADVEGMDSEYEIVMAWHKDNKSSVLHQFIDHMEKIFADGPFERLSLKDYK